MTTLTVEEALANIYLSLENDNDDLDNHILQLKAALPDGENAVTVDPAKIPHNNRQGRKVMQSYFRKRGVIVNFLAA